MMPIGMLWGEIFSLQWRNVIRGLQTAPSSLQNDWCLKGQDPLFQLDFWHREGCSGARQSVQMLSPSP